MEPKLRILQKADELFSRFGLRAVSMDEIAAGAGMSKKTLYQHFEDKDALVDAVFGGELDHECVCCNQDRGVSVNAVHEVYLAYDRIQEMFADMNPTVLLDLEKYYPTTYIKFETFKNTFLYGIVRDNLRRGIEEELYRSDIDVEVLARYRVYSIFFPFAPDAFPPGYRRNLVTIEREVLEHFLHGVVTTKGRTQLQKYRDQRKKEKTV